MRKNRKRCFACRCCKGALHQLAAGSSPALICPGGNLPHILPILGKSAVQQTIHSDFLAYYIPICSHFTGARNFVVEVPIVNPSD